MWEICRYQRHKAWSLVSGLWSQAPYHPMSLGVKPIWDQILALSLSCDLKKITQLFQTSVPLPIKENWQDFLQRCAN